MPALQGITWLLLLQSMGELLSRALHLPLPGPVVGMVLLLGALRWQVVREPVSECAGFLLNHLISGELPLPQGAGAPAGARVSNSDPITGQAGWYDVRVRIRPAEPEEAAQSFPQVDTMLPVPGIRGGVAQVMRYFAGKSKP